MIVHSIEELLSVIKNNDLSSETVAYKHSKQFIPADIIHLIHSLIAEEGKNHHLNGFLNLKGIYSPREQACIELLMIGKSNKQIARNLGLSTRTVEQYIATLLGKFAVRSRLELVLKLMKKI